MDGTIVRSVSLYEEQWNIIHEFAEKIKENRSVAIRRIIMEWQEQQTESYPQVTKSEIS